MTLLELLAVSWSFLANEDFWINVGVLATTYGVFALGIQLNVGTTGIMNFGQAGFMAVGSYAMGILVVKSGPLVLARARPGDPASRSPRRCSWASPRSASEPTTSRSRRSRSARSSASSRTTGTGSPEATSGSSATATRGPTRRHGSTAGWSASGSRRASCCRCCVVNLAILLVLTLLVALMVRSPWGRVLRAIREDEDAARALGKNTFVYKLQSLSIAAALAAIAGYMLAINISILSPANFDPVLTAYAYVIVILGGLGSYLGVVVGSFFLIFVLEATRYIELPLSDARVAALRFMIVGLVLMLLVVFRPQGLFGKRQELTLRAR